jgi:hypothetical protein
MTRGWVVTIALPRFRPECAAAVPGEADTGLIAVGELGTGGFQRPTNSQIVSGRQGRVTLRKFSTSDCSREGPPRSI